MNIYLDIDGVLINKKGEPFPHLEEFIKHITNKYDVYWLTTWCRDGNPERAIQKLNKFVEEKYLKKIKPTSWNTWKTEAINWRENFSWIDDEIFPEERKALIDKGMENHLFLIHPNNDNHFQQLDKAWALWGGSSFDRLQKEHITKYK